MRNAEKPNLSSVLDYQRDIEPYKFIKIFSGVGSGKTQFACSMILGDKEKGIPKQTVLLITSRRSTVEETLKKMGATPSDRPRLWEISQLNLMGSTCRNMMTMPGSSGTMMNFFLPMSQYGTKAWSAPTPILSSISKSNISQVKAPRTFGNYLTPSSWMKSIR